MNEIKKIRFLGIIKDPVDTDKLAKIKGGVIFGGYSCDVVMCIRDWSGVSCDSESEMCQNMTCTTSVVL